MAFEPYRLQDMGGGRAIRILAGLLAELSEIDPSEMTTFELNIIRLCAQNPPASEFKGIESSFRSYRLPEPLGQTAGGRGK